MRSFDVGSTTNDGSAEDQLNIKWPSASFRQHFDLTITGANLSSSGIQNLNGGVQCIGRAEKDKKYKYPIYRILYYIIKIHIFKFRNERMNVGFTAPNRST